MNIELLLLLAMLAVIAYDTYRGATDYPAFKRYSETHDRQRILRSWVLQSFTLSGIGSLIVLAFLGRWPALLTLPAEFSEVLPRLRIVSSAAGEADDSVVTAPFLLGMLTVPIIVGCFTWLVRKRSAASPVSKPVGDYDALYPRNGGERWWAVALSINAGFSEELLFRLVLPLLLYVVLGDAVLSIAIATLAFGLAHWYQGWQGVIATTLAGGFLAAVYLWIGHLWVVMLIHACIDLHAFVLRPLLRGGQRASATP